MAMSAADIPDAELRLALAGGIGPKLLSRLLERFETPEAIVDASSASLRMVEGIGARSADSIRRELEEAPVDVERQRIGDAGASFIFRSASDYPRLLSLIPDPPVALWVRGEVLERDQVALAIVGSRKCTAYGRDQTGRFAGLLAQSGLTIVSGGARGIDGEAHRGALRVEGRTIVVCGCGLAETYPPEHADLFDRIAAGRGAIVSEYPMTAPPRAEHFPRRNRIISGLSLGVLVVEAGRRSGALITARQATEDHNREVMALPGRIDSPASAGCLQAIRDGWAAMVLDHADVIAQLESSQHLIRGAIDAAFDGAAQSPAEETTKMMNLFELSLSDRQKEIVGALHDAGGSAALDDLIAATQIPAHEMMAELTIMQIQRVVRRDDRGIHIAKPK